MAKPAVRRIGGSAGGDRLEVDRGGTIKVLALASGGSIVGSGGTRAAHIANRSMTSVTAGSVLATKFNINMASLASGLNSVITAMRVIGVLATS